jgi:multiple sugar transport system permease protein
MHSWRATPYLLLTPAVFIVSVVLLYPLAANVVLAFFTWDFGDFGTAEFVGVNNFTSMFSENALFWTSVRFTVLFTATTIAIELALGLGAALVLNQLRRGRGVVTALVLIPYIVAPLSVGVLWRLLFRDPSPLTFVLGLVGIPEVYWLSDPKAAFWAVVIAEVWRSTPFVILILLAALAGVPQQLLEAAKMDGAGALLRFRHVMLPLVRPAATVVLVFLLIFKIRVFDLVVTLTAGGPANSTMPIGLLLRQEYFLYQDSGGAAALGVILLLAGAAAALISFRLVYRKVEL